MPDRSVGQLYIMNYNSFNSLKHIKVVAPTIYQWSLTMTTNQQHRWLVNDEHVPCRKTDRCRRQLCQKHVNLEKKVRQILFVRIAD